MRTGSAIVSAVLLLGLGACTRHHDDALETRSEAEKRAEIDKDTAARKAGRAAYKISEEAEKAAKAAGRELKQAGSEAGKGWSEARRAEKEKQREKEQHP